MSAFSPYTSKSSNPACTDLTMMAEQELSAFFRAVTELFGSEQARLAAEDWLDELIESDAVPSSTREWRGITAKASGRLVHRAQPSCLLTESRSV